MLEFILQALKVVLPFIAAGVVVRYIKVRNEKKQNEFEENNKTTSEDETVKYEIAYSAVIYGIMYACFIVFAVFLICAYFDGELDWFTGTIFGGACGLGVYGVMGTHIWKIWIDGKNIIYRDYIGVKHYYTFDDITHVMEKRNGAFVFYAGKKRAFKIDNNLIEGRLLATTLAKNGAQRDLEGMSMSTFTLKPQPVYWVVSAMCAGFCGWATVGLYKQTGMDNILFWSMAVCFVISTVLLIDILSDRFSIDENQVVRKRGLVTKRFQVDEIENIRLRKGLFRENLEFYVNGKKITKVWTKNRPYELLRKRMAIEKIHYRR